MAKIYAQIKNIANRVRDIPLTDVMGITGSVQDKYDKRKWHTSRGAISITGQKFMNWPCQTGGGGAIDLVIHLNRLDFKSAVLWLSDRFPDGVDPLPPRTQSAEKHVFQLPEKNDPNLPAVIDYLHHLRKIPMHLIEQLIESGKLYADIRSNAVFLLLGKEKKAVGAELRGTSQKRWVGMARGSKKELGAFSIKARNPKNIVICESAIDAISYFALYPDCIAVSTSGATPAPFWLYKLANVGINIFCGFDDDEAGNRNADEMIRLFPIIKRRKPEKHDWNDVLKSNLKSS
jgi:hypothetical protein